MSLGARQGTLYLHTLLLMQPLVPLTSESVPKWLAADCPTLPVLSARFHVSENWGRINGTTITLKFLYFEYHISIIVPSAKS